VAWRELELYDYPTVCKKMMDLGTIKRKLARNHSGYQSPAQCAEDIRLVWRNCMRYNAQGSDFWLIAKSLSKKFEDRYRRIRKNCAFFFRSSPATCQRVCLLAVE